MLTAPFRLRTGAKPITSLSIRPENWRIEEEGSGLPFLLTELKTNVMKAHWKFLLLSLSIYLNFKKPSNLDLNVTKKKKLVELESEKKYVLGKDFCYSNSCSSRHVDHNIYFSKCRESEKHHFCLCCFKALDLVFKYIYIYVTNAIYQKSDAFASMRARDDSPIYQPNKHPTED